MSKDEIRRPPEMPSGSLPVCDSPVYVPLWVKSHHSFLEGASSPEELVDRAADLGLKALALTDRNGVYGIVRAYMRAKERSIRLIVGVQMDVQIEAEEGLFERVVLLPQDASAYSRLCQLVSVGHQRGEKGQAWLYPQELNESSQGLFALTQSRRLLGMLHRGFDERLYALIARHRHATDRSREHHLSEFTRALGIREVACTEVLYHHAGRRPLQDIMTCIRHGNDLSTAGTTLKPNAEYTLRSHAEMRAIYVDRPELLHASLEIAEQCRFSLDNLRYRYPAEALPDDENEQSWLCRLAYQGASQRYPEGIPKDVRAQLEKELKIIEDLQYGGYFLTMHEIVGFCREKHILCQGRGSAANSVVCFCLGITAIDPVRMDLLFERFLSRERAEPPDIDLDIEHERREEVIQHVYQRYGRRHAAMVSNVVRYRARSAVREVGKALAIPKTDIDAIARLLSYWTGEVDEETLRSAGLDPRSPRVKHLLRLTQQMQDTPRHQSIHPGGFLLGHLPVDHLVPIEPATMEGRTVIQWDKYDVENLGLFKVDLLGLGALTCIRKAFALLKEHQDIDLAIHTVPVDDTRTFEMCSRGDTVGVFQIESRAQMAMLPRLRPKVFYDLVIQVAIVRPGPIQGEMVHPYLRRRHGHEPIEYPHDALVPVLGKTLGVPLFQEQVMKLAVIAAGYSAGEADQLRRDMAAWRSAGKIEQHRERMIPQMIAFGIEPEFAERVFDQIRGFGEYGFPESHAASFALLAYVTAYLRAHHPATFTCALLNSMPMGFYSAASLIEDAKRHQVEVRPLSVNDSQWDHTLVKTEEGFAIQMGLRLVSHLGQRERHAIHYARVSMLRPLRSRPSSKPVQNKKGGGAERLVLKQGQGGSSGKETADPVSFFLRPAFTLSPSPSFSSESFTSGASGKSSGLVLSRAPLSLSRTPLRLSSPPLDLSGSAVAICPSPHTSGPSSPSVFGVQEPMSVYQSRASTQPDVVPQDLISSPDVVSPEVVSSLELTRPFTDLTDFVRRTSLGERALVSLAEAGAFDCLKITRRNALWQLRALVRAKSDSLPEMSAQTQLSFSSLDRDDAVLWDYRASGHSARGHPMQRYRVRLRAQAMPTAVQVASLSHGSRVTYVGQVICRQRPMTASGVTFFTLEDETGFVNLVVWSKIFDAHRILAKTAILLGVRGHVQHAERPTPLPAVVSPEIKRPAASGGPVSAAHVSASEAKSRDPLLSPSHGSVHLIAHSLFLPELKVHHEVRSRDFH